MTELPAQAGEEIEALVRRGREALEDDEEVRAALAAAPRAVAGSIGRVFACSDFVAQSCARDRRLVPQLLEGGRLLAASDPAEIAATVPRLAGSDLAAEQQFMADLRRWRRREMVRIAWRDLAGWSPLEETLAALSAVADAAISAATDAAYALLAARYGVPRSSAGVQQPFVVVGMGKLGGGELNFSSDVDLVFLFPEHGDTDGSRPITNEEFFTRLGQLLIRMLDAPTVDGYVFRVDMRLRPFGDSGPLAASFASFEDYLVIHGRDWERYAWIKARAITGAAAYAEVFAGCVRPFVFRRYLDFGVFESLREMKALIGREVERRDLADHVKLGPGGIREVEFVVQMFQLLRGGQDRRLQAPSLLTVLPQLAGGRLLPARAVAELREAYDFLRRLENRLQMLADEQTHRLPRDPLARRRIALAMDAPDWETLLERLDVQRRRVSAHFDAVVLAPGGARPAGALDLAMLWAEEVDGEALAGPLAGAGFGADAGEAARLLVELRESSLVRRLDETGRRRLQALLPALVAQAGASVAPLPVLRRVLRIVEAIGQRSSYFALLQESGAARRRLIELCGHGDFLAAQIAAHPLLLDELLDERILSELPDRAALEQDLDLRLGGLPEDDPERQVEGLRFFQRAAVFRVAAADLTGRLPVMKVSDRLTEIAELIVERAMQLAWQQITAQFGVPHCGEGTERRPVRICTVGYGKLGGIELGYSSDLDLVFLHDSRGAAQETDAAKALDNQVFFVRLAQRIVHLLTMHSSAGRLYEVDMRLRPSGKGGMLVTSIDAFAEYQRTEAWTWEHQALLHARAVAGSPELRAAFEAVRLAALVNDVRRDTLRDEVRSMRERMRRELSKAQGGEFDIKQDPGGIADIEFLAQYWALRWAKEHPAVAIFSDTIRQLETVASGDLVPQATVDQLTGAYRAYRVRTHHLSLDGRKPVVPDAEFAAEREAVVATWNATMQA